jgi:HEAT repeat protein
VYYQAFSLYRLGGDDKLRSAKTVLSRHTTKYPGLAKGEPRALRTRICGELARRGDEECAAEVAAAARATEARPATRSNTSSRTSTTAGCPAEDDDDDERIAALNALLQMDAERAMPVLTKVLERRDACSAPLRRKAVFLVSQKRTPETADLLLKIARNDPDKETREQAVFWLSQVSDERAVDMLQDILRNSNEEGLQNKALFALSQHRSGRGGAILREFAERDGTSEELRGQAIFWLGQRSSAENNAFLRTLYTKLKSEELKDKVIFSLSQRKNMGNEKWMMDIVTNPRETTEMRKKALFWAGQNPAMTAELIPYYDRLAEREMKEQMIFVLSQRRSGPAMDKLFAIAKNDKDPELRKKAIFWLGQSRDPRVQQFLLDIINQ